MTYYLKSITVRSGRTGCWDHGANLNPSEKGIGYGILTQGNRTDEESGVRDNI